MNINDIKTKGKKITWDSLIKDDYISQAKVDIALHPAKFKVIVGAKQCGKTFIGLLNMVKSITENEYYNGWAFRKYSTGAAKAMGNYLIRVSNELNQLGYEIPKQFKLNQSELFYGNSRTNTENQVINFSSLDDYSGSTDGKPPAFGYVGDVVFDEAVIEKDALEPDKIPTNAQWDKLKGIVDSNLSRYTLSFLKSHKEAASNIKDTTFWFFMNNWGPHPEIVKADEVFPETDFIEWVLGQPLDSLIGDQEAIDELFNDPEWVEGLKARNTLSMYDKENDVLYSRMTVFGNPQILEQPKLVKRNLGRIKAALFANNIQNLCIYLGMRQTPMLEDDMRVYPEQVIRNLKLKEVEETGLKVVGASYGVDVDISRVLTITPVLLLADMFGEQQTIYVDKQIEIHCAGAGVNGTNLDQYTKFVIKEITKHIHENKLYGINSKKILIDDNQQFFLRDLAQSELSAHFRLFAKPIKVGKTFDIDGRQNMTIAGMINDLIIFNPKNKELINDFRICQKRGKYDQRRDTTGTRNYLDRIDSFEYGMQPYTSVIWKQIKGGR